VNGATERWMRHAGVPVQDFEETVRALRRMAASDLLLQGDQASTILWRATVQAVLSPRRVAEILADLAPALDRSQAQARALFDTQMTIFGRTVEAAKTEALGPSQPFLYAGPVDLKTRDWCLQRVGKVFTREEIDAMDNDQLPNTFLTAGGYNCRHSFLAVESHALKGLAGTSERAPGFEDDVQYIRQLKEQRKRKKAA
jgi:hypothetical protein